MNSNESNPSSNKQIIHYEPTTSWCCCTTYKDRSKFQNILQHLELSDVQKQIIQSRYLNILENLQKRARNHSIVFFIGHFIITVGSLLVPALLSIQNSDKAFSLSGAEFNIQIYWTTFIISLLVTMWNAILTLFKIDKKYYFIHTTLERLRSEGWQYFGLTGRYSGHLLANHTQPTHQNQFIFFCHYIEKIKMKQVEEEYYKTDEKSSQAPNTFNQTTPSTNNSSELFPPSLDKSINSMIQNIPEPIQNTLQSIIKSQNIIEIPSPPTVIDIHSNDTPTQNEIILPTNTSSDQKQSSDSTSISINEIEKAVDTSKINSGVHPHIPKSMKSFRNLLQKGGVELGSKSVTISEKVEIEKNDKENK
jgi:Protein of unknown function (DUF4231)